MRLFKGCFMLVVAVVVTLNNFFYAVNPAAAKPFFDWLDPFAIVALGLVFIDKLLGAQRGDTDAPRLVVTVLVGGAGASIRLQLPGEDGGQWTGEWNRVAGAGADCGLRAPL